MGMFSAHAVAAGRRETSLAPTAAAGGETVSTTLSLCASTYASTATAGAPPPAGISSRTVASAGANVCEKPGPRGAPPRRGSWSSSSATLSGSPSSRQLDDAEMGA